MRITLVRHGQTEWNRLGRVQGVSDIPLNDVGREQASQAAILLAQMNEDWTTLTSSPLIRARETAEIIANCLETDLAPAVPLLREQHYGEAEGASMKEFHSRWPNRDWKEGESTDELISRAFAALTHLETIDPSGNVLAVSHGGLIRHLVAAVAGLPRRKVPPIDNAAATTFQRATRDSWRVTRLNNEPAQHLLPQTGSSNPGPGAW